ncbi:MAG: hypothetical protein NVV74_01200 [Magnetospirillum sp.]|nr:hypothetical protein [Magnetospirillum sp.]
MARLLLEWRHHLSEGGCRAPHQRADFRCGAGRPDRRHRRGHRRVVGAYPGQAPRGHLHPGDLRAPGSWFIGGRSLAAQGKNAFHLDISITDETNTKQEKAEFIAQAHAALDGLVGNLHPASFIHVIDARASAYGYGGKTQEYRYHRD